MCASVGVRHYGVERHERIKKWRRKLIREKAAGASRGSARRAYAAGASLALGALCAGASTPAVAQAQGAVDKNAPRPPVLPAVMVVGTTPLLGIGTPLAEVPANVQTVNAQDIATQHRETLTDFFAANLPGVSVTDARAILSR